MTFWATMGCGHSQIGVAPRDDGNKPLDRGTDSNQGTPNLQHQIEVQPASTTFQLQDTRPSPAPSPVLLQVWYANTVLRTPALFVLASGRSPGLLGKEFTPKFGKGNRSVIEVAWLCTSY